MIECPICHVMNEDHAHFCSECGQRFAPGMPSGPASAPPADSFQPAPTSFPPSFGTPPEPPPPQPPAPPTNPFVAAFQSTSPQPQPSNYSYAESMPDASYAPQAQPHTHSDATALSPPAQYPQDEPPVSPGNYQDQFAAHSISSQQADPYAYGGPASPPQPDPNSMSQEQSGQFQDHFGNFDQVETEHERPDPPKRKTRLHSPILGGGEEEAPEPDRPIPAKRPHLRSPLLGADEGEEDPSSRRGRGFRSPLLDRDEEPPPAAPARGKLRSPLIGGDDSDQPAPRPTRPSKGLRSPLLSGDEEEPAGRASARPTRPTGETAYPHRRSGAQPSDNDEPPSKPRTTGGLRSPLLGGADEDEPSQPTRGGRPEARFPGPSKPKLRSPVLGDYDEYEDEDNDSSYSENDPNVLRSPLMAAKQRLREPNQPQSDSQSMPAASDRRVAQTPGQLQPQPPQGERAPLLNSSPNPPTAQSGPIPEWRSPPAPQAVPPPNEDNIWPPHQHAADPQPERAAPSPTPFAVPQEAPAPAPRFKARSPLLANTEEDELPAYGSRHAQPSQPSGPILIVAIPAVIALIGKLMYFADILQMAQRQPLPPSYYVDPLGSILLCIGLIIFSFTAGKRS